MVDHLGDVCPRDTNLPIAWLLQVSSQWNSYASRTCALESTEFVYKYVSANSINCTAHVTRVHQPCGSLWQPTTHSAESCTRGVHVTLMSGTHRILLTYQGTGKCTRDTLHICPAYPRHHLQRWKCADLFKPCHLAITKRFSSSWQLIVTISVCGVDKLVVHASIGLEYNMKKRNLKMRTEGFILTCRPNAAPQVILT